MTEVEVENDPTPDTEWYTPSPAATSLYRYYKTLPMTVQEHAGVKDIYLGLEFYTPDLKDTDK